MLLCEGRMLERLESSRLKLDAGHCQKQTAEKRKNTFIFFSVFHSVILNINTTYTQIADGRYLKWPNVEQPSRLFRSRSARCSQAAELQILSEVLLHFLHLICCLCLNLNHTLSPSSRLSKRVGVELRSARAAAAVYSVV